MSNQPLFIILCNVDNLGGKSDDCPLQLSIPSHSCIMEPPDGLVGDSSSLTVREDEVIKSIQTTNSGKAPTSEEVSSNFTENEDVAVADDGGVLGNNNRGDEGVMEGVAIGNADEFSSDSEDEVSRVRFSYL